MQRFLMGTMAALTAVTLLGPTPAAAQPASPALAVMVLTSDGKLAAGFDNAPGQLSAPAIVSGVSAGQTLVAIDVRPQNAQLYGLGYNASNGTLQLYHINPGLTFATPIGSTGSFVDGGGNSLRVGVDANTQISMDFNPAVDRLRVVTSNGPTGPGQNFRINPNTGEFVDGSAGSPATITQDGAINGGTTSVSDTAYTNNQPYVTATTQYTIDAASDAIYIQNSPNSGTQTLPKPVTLNGAPLNFTDATMDIAPGVNAAASNTAVTAGSAVAALRSGDMDSLYRIDLTSGAATALGNMAPLVVRDVAIYEPTPIAMGLSTDGTQLRRFNPRTPATTSTINFSGVAPNEQLVGIDIRPATGQLYGLGINNISNTGTLYRIDPQSGVATEIVVNGVAFTTDAVTPVDLPDPAVTGYGVAFNGAVDRLRVVTGNGFNFRVNPNTGLGVDGNANTNGINMDGALNGAATGASIAGYVQTGPLLANTALYDINTSTDQLLRQTAPNTGTLALIGPLGVDGSEFGGLADIGAGRALAALTVGGSTNVYTVSLTSGAATLAGTVGQGTTSLRGLTATTPGEVAVSAPATVTEGQSLTVTFTRTNGSLPLVAGYTLGGSAASGSDYTATVVPLLFMSGELSKTVTIPITSDSVVENGETLTITLVGASGGGRSASVTLEDNIRRIWLPFVRR